MYMRQNYLDVEDSVWLVNLINEVMVPFPTFFLRIPGDFFETMDL